MGVLNSTWVLQNSGQLVYSTGHEQAKIHDGAVADRRDVLDS